MVVSSSPSSATIIATRNGCVMYGSPDRRTWVACAVRAGPAASEESFAFSACVANVSTTERSSLVVRISAREANDANASLRAAGSTTGWNCVQLGGGGEPALQVDELAVDRHEAQLGLHAGHRLVEVDGLGDVVDRADAKALDQQYDFITASEVVEHFYSPQKEFDLLANQLKPNGLLALMTALYDDSIDFKNWYYRKDPTHVAFYSRATFNYLARKYYFLDPEFIGPRVILLQKRS